MKLTIDTDALQASAERIGPKKARWASLLLADALLGILRPVREYATLFGTSRMTAQRFLSEYVFEGVGTTLGQGWDKRPLNINKLHAVLGQGWDKRPLPLSTPASSPDTSPPAPPLLTPITPPYTPPARGERALCMPAHTCEQDSTAIPQAPFPEENFRTLSSARRAALMHDPDRIAEYKRALIRKKLTDTAAETGMDSAMIDAFLNKWGENTPGSETIRAEYEATFNVVSRARTFAAAWKDRKPARRRAAEQDNKFVNDVFDKLVFDDALKAKP